MGVLHRDEDGSLRGVEEGATPAVALQENELIEPVARDGRANYRDGWDKLSRRIFGSTVWEKDAETRIVWITLITKAQDPNGPGHGDVPMTDEAIARLANIPLEKTKEALAIFLGPEAGSRTPDYEGRRLIRINGGYRVLNASIYNRPHEAAGVAGRKGGEAKSAAQRRREADAERKRLKRAEERRLRKASASVCPQNVRKASADSPRTKRASQCRKTLTGKALPASTPPS